MAFQEKYKQLIEMTTTVGQLSERHLNLFYFVESFVDLFTS